MHVNLLPPAFVWRRLSRKRLRQWACAFGFVTIAFIGGNARLLAQWWLDLREFQAMHLAAEPVIALQAERVKLAKRTAALAQKIKLLESIATRDRSTAILGIVSNSIASTHSALQLQEIQVAIEAKPIDGPSDKSSLANKAPSSPPISQEHLETFDQYRMSLKGIAVESDAISALMENLQRSTVFPKVELRSTQERMVSERLIQEFQLECVGNE